MWCDTGGVLIAISDLSASMCGATLPCLVCALFLHMYVCACVCVVSCVSWVWPEGSGGLCGVRGRDAGGHGSAHPLVCNMVD